MPTCRTDLLQSLGGGRGHAERGGAEPKLIQGNLVPSVVAALCPTLSFTHPGREHQEPLPSPCTDLPGSSRPTEARS